MPNVLIIGFTGEGDTDRRFLGPIIQRTFTDLLLEARGQVDCLTPLWLGVGKGEAIAEKIKEAKSFGPMLICVHIDQDRAGRAET